MVKRFVPRQRKRKVLDRQRAEATREAAEDGQNGENNVDQNAESNGDSNALIIEKKKKALREELRPEGTKFSSKKAKRLEKYIETKLRKDESRELLAKLAANKIDTSLFSSARSLGQVKETKKEAMSRALREQHAGLPSDKKTVELLYEPRQIGKEPPPAPAQQDSSRSMNTPASQKKPTQESVPHQEEVPTQPTPTIGSGLKRPLEPTLPAAGSGLKRPLDLDESGRPVIAKRQKRGGVKTKHPVTEPVVVMKPYEPAWEGFSSEGEDGSSGEESSEDSDASESESEGSAEGSEEESGSEESGSEDGSGSEDEDSSEESSEDEDGDSSMRTKERSSAFKAWAHSQRNAALGYQGIEAGGSSILEIPKPANFKPRPIEQEPLPIELQPTTNTTRKAYAVTVNRSQEIQDVRFRLPVVAEEQKIMEAIHNNDIVVICGATGSGKTTQLPQFLFEAGYGDPNGPTPGMIGVTQPRRVAAVSMSKRVAQEMGDHSHVVAYRIRFEGNLDPRTAIKFMTDGVLLREVAQDIALRKYSAIIIDEAHERSVNTDILVAMLSRVVKLRAEMALEDASIKPLKLIIMSATLRIEDLTQNPALFKTPPRVVEVEGREHPVTIHFSRQTRPDYLEEAFKKISRGHRKLPPGGMLVFLTGQGEIAQLSKRLKSAFGGMNSAVLPKVRISGNDAPMETEDIDFGDVEDRNVNDMGDDDEVAFFSDEEDDDNAEFDIEDEEAGTGPLKMHILPLYSLLPTNEQMRVFEPPPDGSRLVILATNVAETSLTIPGIRYVFDCGRSKERKYDPVSGVQSFQIDWISKASAKQRAGRAGRTGPGHCWRLYSSAVYERDFAEFAVPELLRTPLEGVVLQLKAMKLANVVNFPFPTPPPREALAKAERLLTYLSAVSPSGQVTKIGSTMSFFPLSPRFARILLIGHLHECIPYTIAMVAALSAGEIFIPPNQAIPPETEQGEEGFRTTEDTIADARREKLRKAYAESHKRFCFLDDKSDAIKLLQVLGEFAHDPTEQWCKDRFVRFKALKEATMIRKQIKDLLRTNIPAFANLEVSDKLDPPSPKQVQALKQMVAAGFIDQVAIRADKAPNPPEMYRKPKRAIEVPYLPLIPLEGAEKLEPEDKLVYIHPASPLARLSLSECPDYVVYSHLQKTSNTGADGQKKPKTRMHTLTDITGAQLAALAKGTPLISYGKPIKEVKAGANSREVWVVPYLRAEGGAGGLGWPLPAKKVTQKKVPGQGWVTE